MRQVSAMINSEYKNRLVRDPKCCGGELIIRDTRVTVRSILASLAEGDRPEEIVAAFPSLCLEDVRAAIAFSAENLCDDFPRQIVLRNAS